MTATFADPTRDAQRAFRAILEALARPTRAFPMVGPAQPPTPLSSAGAAVALTLCDEETPVWLDTVLAGDGTTAAWFAFATGASVIADPTRAAFLFATGFEDLPPLPGLAAGTPERPDLSATIVLDVRDPEAGGSPRAGGRFRATGPGIDGHCYFDASWASPGFLDTWRHNTQRFPLGVDLLVVEGAAVRGLPRTTLLEGVG